MIEEFENRKYSYQMLSIKHNCKITYEDISNRFNYTPKFLKPGEFFELKGWNLNQVIELINDILNNSKYKLISVSEDSDYVRYHFVS